MAINTAALKKMNTQEKLLYMNMLLTGQLDSEKNFWANLSNASAILYAAIEDLNWAGFYLLHGKELVLGPFQGLPACNRIEVGKGVCGKAVQEGRSLLVEDVHDFPGHIAWDSASNSELVVPIRDTQGKVRGVIALDSPIINRFTTKEQEGVEAFSKKLGSLLDWRAINPTE